MRKYFPFAMALIVFAASAQALAQDPQAQQYPQGQPGYQGQQGPQGRRPEPPKMKEPSEMAKEIADRMQAEVSLDKKQYKKVYKLLKKDFEYRKQARENSFQGGMPPQGGPGGEMMGGPGGGMPGGGMSGGGMMGGPGGGMPGDGMQGGPGGGMPPQGGPGMGPGDDVITEEYLEKQDQKLRKILTAPQYEKWRAKHPAEHLELPPMDVL